VNEKSGGATTAAIPKALRLLDTNAGIYRDIVPKVVAAAPRAVLLVVTDPPDPLADLARRLADTITCSAPARCSTACACVFISPGTRVNPARSRPWSLASTVLRRCFCGRRPE